MKTAKSERPKIIEVWVKLDDVLAVAGDVPSRFAIGVKTLWAEDVIAFARQIGSPLVYGLQAESVKGQRAVMRWLFSHGIDAAVTYIQDPPEDAEVITTWPKTSATNSARPPSPPSATSPAAAPATAPST